MICLWQIKKFALFSPRHELRLLAAPPLRSPLKICHRHIFFTLRRGENPLTQPRPRGTGLGRPDGMMSAQPPWAAFTNDRHRGPRKGAERLWRGEEEQAKRGEVSLSAGPDKAQLVLTRCGGVQGESGEAPPAADAASRFRGSGAIGGPSGAGNRNAATVSACSPLRVIPPADSPSARRRSD